MHGTAKSFLPMLFESKFSFVKKLANRQMLLMTAFHESSWHFEMQMYRVSHKKGIDKKLLFGAAQGLNLQFLNLFGFSISVSFVWCIIQRIWTHLGKVIAVFRRGMCFLAFRFSRKTAIKFQKCFCVTLFQKFVTYYHLE